MKNTQNPKRNLPTPARIAAYIVGVAIVCFFNRAMLRAGNPARVQSLPGNKAFTSADQPQPALELEDWMLLP